MASIKRCEDVNTVGRSGAGAPQVSPGRLSLTCNTPLQLIQQAFVLFGSGHFDFTSVPVEGGPSWIQSARYTIGAKADGNPALETMMGPMLQKLLEDRFLLKIHRETRDVKAYALIIAKGGPKLRRVEDGSCDLVELQRDLAPHPANQPHRDLCGTGGINRQPSNATLNLHAATVEGFSKKLTTVLGRPVIDKTGIDGLFDFKLKFALDESTFGILTPGTGPQTAPDPAASSIFTAVQEQLGLKLDQAKGPGEFLVIDSLERPSDN